MFKSIMTGIAAIAIVLVGGFGLAYYGYLGTAFFAPRYEAIRRDKMIESRAYSEASVRRLYDLKREWETASPDGRRTVELAARHEFSIFPKERLPADLRLWMQQIN